MLKIYPSLMAAKPNDLPSLVKQLEPYCAGFHLDIMDGIFVPPTALSIETVNSIDAATALPSWVHLMVQDPAAWIAKLALKPESVISFHGQATKNIPSIIKLIKEKGCKPAIAISPKTSVEHISPYLEAIDQVDIMSVNPGYAGQPFLKETMAKIAPLMKLREKRKLGFAIAMDGGINDKNIAALAAAGIDAVAVGSAIFAAFNPVEALKEIQKRIR